MAKPALSIRVGTSGWYYDHWRGRFYPESLSKDKWFEYYARHFDTVEINNTFYHLPKESFLKRWYKLAPENFIYTVKANRYITHIKKLKDTAEELERFFNRIKLLKARLGPVLYQLPPSLKQDLDLLKKFAELLPKKYVNVFEFRNNTWYSDDTYELLNQFGMVFCTHDMPGKESPKLVTGKIVYLRFHGATGRYEGNYSSKALGQWADWVKKNAKGVKGIYAYFNNDYNAYAVKNAKKLREILSL